MVAARLVGAGIEAGGLCWVESGSLAWLGLGKSSVSSNKLRCNCELVAELSRKLGFSAAGLDGEAS